LIDIGFLSSCDEVENRTSQLPVILHNFQFPATPLSCMNLYSQLYEYKSTQRDFPLVAVTGYGCEL